MTARRTTGPATRRGRAALRLAAAAFAAAGCSEIGTAPDVPASIEFAPLLSATIAIGDSLRDTAGVATPLRAIVRNVQGDALADAPVRFLYVQFARDSALAVDSVTGHVVAVREATGAPVQVAARSGAALQILRDLQIAAAPDTVVATAPSPLELSLPDAGDDAARRNSVELSVQVQAGPEGARTGVNGWLVRFTVVEPANVANDTTAAAWLLDDSFRPSVLDTTTSGRATRRLRVRASAGLDTVTVEASVRVRGAPVPGGPVRLRVPVLAPTDGD